MDFKNYIHIIILKFCSIPHLIDSQKQNNLHTVCMTNLKAMHSISEVMQTPINTYVLIMCGVYLIPAVRATSSLKEKHTRPLKSNQGESLHYNHGDVTERFAAGQIYSDFSAS